MSLITPWRGRPQVPATMPPPIVDAGLPDSQIIAEELEILLRKRFATVLAVIDREMSAWTGEYRSARLTGQDLADALMDVRNALVKAQVSA
jgi:hypothetical protein